MNRPSEQPRLEFDPPSEEKEFTSPEEVPASKGNPSEEHQDPTPTSQKGELEEECSICGVEAKYGNCPRCINKQRRNTENSKAVVGLSKTKVIKTQEWFPKADGTRAPMKEATEETREAAQRHKRQNTVDRLLRRTHYQNMTYQERTDFANKPQDEKEQLYQDWKKNRNK